MDQIEHKAVSDLYNLPDESEGSHGRADEILLEFLDAKGFRHIAGAYRDTRERIGFWYA